MRIPVLRYAKTLPPADAEDAPKACVLRCAEGGVLEMPELVRLVGGG
jgi:hypothetical protein